MKIKKKELLRLIETYLREQNDEKKSSGGKYKIYFGARSFITDYSRDIAKYLDNYDAGHAWIMVKKPGEGLTSYSGKSGVAFELQRLAQSRDKENDDYLKQMRALRDIGEISPEEYKALVEKSDWGQLRKIKNYEPDTFEYANSRGNYLIEVMPRGNDSQEDVKKAIEKIESAFANYNEDVTYDPIPGSNADVPPDARNSNSFAYTLLKHILGNDKEIEKRVNFSDIKMQLPGWGKLVRGLRPQEIPN